MTTFLVLNFTGFLGVALCMTLIWLLGLRIRNAGVVDIFWSLLVAGLGLYFVVFLQAYSLKTWVMIAMTCVWAVRLAGHIFLRNLKESAEDARYSGLKEKWGDRARINMLIFYWQQGAGVLIFALPIFFVARRPEGVLHIAEMLGVILFGAAVLGEAIADWQLQAFKKDPSNHGKVCRRGLWNYSRHPNYFFEWLVWVSFFVYASGTSWGWLSVICPISMYYFLNYKTGIPLAEKRGLASRGASYAAYQKEVSPFFPWPIKKGAS